MNMPEQVGFLEPEEYQCITIKKLQMYPFRGKYIPPRLKLSPILKKNYTAVFLWL